MKMAGIVVPQAAQASANILAALMDARALTAKEQAFAPHEFVVSLLSYSGDMPA